MTSRVIYLDNNATTPLSDAAKQALIAAADCYGNPSSLHPSGQEARRLVENAREEILRGLGLRSRQKDLHLAIRLNLPKFYCSGNNFIEALAEPSRVCPLK